MTAESPLMFIGPGPDSLRDNCADDYDCRRMSEHVLIMYDIQRKQ